MISSILNELLLQHCSSDTLPRKQHHNHLTAVKPRGMPCFLEQSQRNMLRLCSFKHGLVRRPGFPSLWSQGEEPARGVETLLIANGKYVRFVLSDVLFYFMWSDEVRFPQTIFWSSSSASRFLLGPGAEETRLPSSQVDILPTTSGGVLVSTGFDFRRHNIQSATKTMVIFYIQPRKSARLDTS